MAGFPKPRFNYDYDLTKELKALRDYPKVRRHPQGPAPASALALWARLKTG